MSSESDAVDGSVRRKDNLTYSAAVGCGHVSGLLLRS
jgi:hypothetical protein